MGTQISFPISNYSPNASAFYTSFTIDWSTQKLRVIADLSQCDTQNEVDSQTGTYPDDVFDLTKKTSSSIDWSTPSQPIVHVYCNGSAITLHGVNFSLSDPGATVSLSDPSNVVIEVSQAGGLTINGNSTSITASFLSSFFSESEFTFASQEGRGRMDGTYKSVSVVSKDDVYVPDAVISNITGMVGTMKSLCEDYTATGTTFKYTTDIDWDKEKVIASIDLTNCSTDKDVFAMTPEGGDFSSFHGSATKPNMHWYYATGSTAVTGFWANGSDNCNSGAITVSNHLCNIEISKAGGTRINGTQATNHTPEKLSTLFGANRIVIGSGESPKFSNATYKYIRVVSLDYQEGTTTKSNTIDEAKVNTFATQDHVSVGLTRTLKADNWNTFCVPFALDADKVKSVFGEGTVIREYDNITGTTMNFKEATTIEAGKPYLVKPGHETVNPTFNNVSIVGDEPQQVGADGYYMVGVYGLATLATDGTNLFLGAGSKFYKPTQTGNVMSGMRAYFVVPSGTNYSALYANIDGEATSLDTINADLDVAKDTRVFNLNGQLVGNSLDTLPRGVYVQNGKKVVVR